jgi:Tol biopolymer transport system component
MESMLAISANLPHGTQMFTHTLNRFATLVLLSLTLLAGVSVAEDLDAAKQAELDAAKAEASRLEAELIADARQITFEGRRAGEGYFSADGKQMVFQSERDPSNPFYQIYVTDLETGDIERVSPGTGKTTCAWIHPQGGRVMYASTQDDPAAEDKQAQEIELRNTGKQRRYAWDYDENFEIYSKDLESGQFTRLTDARGYDAEGSYSPDGSQIAFASNRQAYSRDLTQREKQMFETDAAFMMDIYIMNSDGTNVRQLTDVPGYDGGPFFSPVVTRICWRWFADFGATAVV